MEQIGGNLRGDMDMGDGELYQAWRPMEHSNTKLFELGANEGG
jgi:hypothetical protein